MSVLNLQYLAWDDNTVYPAYCRQIRREQKRRNAPIAGKNLAVVEFHGSWQPPSETMFVSGCSSPTEQIHSERHAVNKLAELLNASSKSAEVMAIYTERAPCGTGAGMRNCDGFLTEFLRAAEGGLVLGAGLVKAPLGLKTPVYYSFQYPTSGKEELDLIGSILDHYGIHDEEGCMTLREYHRELGKQDREAVTNTLKRFDKSILTRVATGRVTKPSSKRQKK